MPTRYAVRRADTGQYYAGLIGHRVQWCDRLADAHTWNLREASLNMLSCMPYGVAGEVVAFDPDEMAANAAAHAERRTERAVERGQIIDDLRADATAGAAELTAALDLLDRIYHTYNPVDAATSPSIDRLLDLIDGEVADYLGRHHPDWQGG